jgi:hypothetical protein
VHGRARGLLPRGIDPKHRGKPDGEVTAQGVVGAALPTLGAHRGHDDVQGGMGCSCSVSARWGRVRVSAGRRLSIGGRWRQGCR